MATDKGSPVTILSSQSLGVAGTKTSDWFDWLEKQAMTTYVLITNGTPGPDDRPIVTIEVADDALGTRAREVFRSATDTDDALVTNLVHRHAMTDRYLRVIVDNSLGDQAITIEAHAHVVDHLG